MENLYWIWNENNELIQGFFKDGENPINSKLVLENDNFLKPLYDREHDVIIEGATQEDIEIFNKPYVPKTISQLKLRMQLIISGISIASIYAMIEQVSDKIQKELIYTKWEYAVVFDRNDATLNQMAKMLEITSDQLDDIFINGNKL